MRRLLLGMLVLFTWPQCAAALTFSYLTNGIVKVGVVNEEGAGVGYFSQVSPERNLINYGTDPGRMVQQSFYGSDTQSWNPVQGGCSGGLGSTVQQMTNDGTTIYAKTIPKDWRSCSAETGVTMEEWITLSGSVAMIHYKFSFTGSTTLFSPTLQEVPAAYFDGALNYLSYYGGANPWTGDTLSTYIPQPLAPPVVGEADTISENWFAFTDNTNWGIGLMSTGFISGRIGAFVFTGDGTYGPLGYGCSYGAITPTFAVTNTPFEFTVYLTIGTLSQIRTTFSQLRYVGYAASAKANYQ